jgi:hypothetical protein
MAAADHGRGDAIGRYTILLMQTVVIMRPETKDSIGPPDGSR